MYSREDIEKVLDDLNHFGIIHHNYEECYLICVNELKEKLFGDEDGKLRKED